MLLVMLALPGSVYLYQGEELGLWEVEDLADDDIRDPVWEGSRHTIRGRDGCRVPMPWSGAQAPFGFTTGTGWLPQPRAWADCTAESHAGHPESVLEFYRRSLAARRADLAGRPDTVEWVDCPHGVLIFDRPGVLRCVLNLSVTPHPITGPVRVSSSP